MRPLRTTCGSVGIRLAPPACWLTRAGVRRSTRSSTSITAATARSFPSPTPRAMTTRPLSACGRYRTVGTNLRRTTPSLAPARCSYGSVRTGFHGEKRPAVGVRSRFPVDPRTDLPSQRQRASLMAAIANPPTLGTLTPATALNSSSPIASRPRRMERSITSVGGAPTLRMTTSAQRSFTRMRSKCATTWITPASPARSLPVRSRHCPIP